MKSRLRMLVHHLGVLFIGGDYVETLPPARCAFWKNMAQVKFIQGGHARGHV